MTAQSEILNDSKYIPCLDKGFVGLVDAMPSNHGDGDLAIVQAARVSYGQGTKQISENKGLIRYLIRHNHTTPLEMVEFKFHMKLPIFIARQLIRHRTANVNEYSGRYSIMPEEFYIPETDKIQPQSKDNKQGRNGDFPKEIAELVQSMIQRNSEDSYKLYERLIGMNPLSSLEEFYKDENQENLPEDGLGSDFSGIARELARIVLPLNCYTEWYWKCDLKNLLHFISLRSDSHAQYEIRVFSDAIADLIKPYAPITFEAFDDYVVSGKNLSKQEIETVSMLLKTVENHQDKLLENLKNNGVSNREIKELFEKLKIS